MEILGLGWEQALLVLLAAVWAGAINTVVGSGTLVTFPVLVAMGVPPVSATVSNAMGLIAGNFTGAWGYRREIAQVKPVLMRLLPASIIGGAIGAALLIMLPEEVFGRVAPVLIVISLAFVIFQPRLSRWVKARAAEREGEDPQQAQAAAADQPQAMPTVSLVLLLMVFFAGIYGGYFVAAQGILLMGVLGVFLMANIQQANGIKNMLVAVVNLTAAISYVIVDFLIRDPEEPQIIWWGIVLIIAVGSTFGGLIGAWVGRRLPPTVLRTVIVLLGLVALFVMVRNLVVG